MPVEHRADLAPAAAMQRALDKLCEQGPWKETEVEAMNILRAAIRQAEQAEEARRRGLFK